VVTPQPRSGVPPFLGRSDPRWVPSVGNREPCPRANLGGQPLTSTDWSGYYTILSWLSSRAPEDARGLAHCFIPRSRNGFAPDSFVSAKGPTRGRS